MSWLIIAVAVWIVFRVLRNAFRPKYEITATISESDDEEDDDWLARWEALPEQSLTEHDDPVVQFLIDNKGQERTIRYYGKYRKVHVLDVIEKEDMPFPYLRARAEGEKRTFSFEHITLPARKKE